MWIPKFVKRAESESIDKLVTSSPNLVLVTADDINPKLEMEDLAAIIAFLQLAVGTTSTGPILLPWCCS